MPEIFQYEFMIRAFIGGALVGVTAPALGMFLVLRRLALIADSLSHVALAGVAIGLLTQTFPPVVGLGATSVAAVAIETVRLKKLMPGDAALAVVLYSALAVAVVIISLADDIYTHTVRGNQDIRSPKQPINGIGPVLQHLIKGQYRFCLGR